MQFVVDYRAADGSRQQKEIEAADRKAAFAELSRLGISAITLREGTLTKKAKTANDPSKPLPPSVIRFVVTVCALVVLSIVVWLFVGKAKPVGESKVVTPAKSVKVDKKSYKNVDEISRVKPRKNDNRQPKSIEEAVAILDEAQEPVKIAPIHRVLTNSVHSTFKSGTEQLLSWIFTTELGDAPIPLPPISPKDRENLAVILLSKNEISEEDTQATSFAKEAVDSVKAEMIKFVKEGGDPDDFLKYYNNELRKAYEIRREALRMVDEVGEEDPEMAAALTKKFNEKLEADGIKTISTKFQSVDEEVEGK